MSVELGSLGDGDLARKMVNVMTPEQLAHRAFIVKEAAFLINEKYARGAAEHNTNLKEDTSIAQLLDFAIEEAIDQIVYLLTIKQKYEETNETSQTGE